METVYAFKERIMEIHIQTSASQPYLRHFLIDSLPIEQLHCLIMLLFTF